MYTHTHTHTADLCYQEDWDNYLDIIIDASSPRAAEAITHIKAYYQNEGYKSVYNPGGPGMVPTPGVRYTTPAPAQVRRRGRERPAGHGRRLQWRWQRLAHTVWHAIPQCLLRFMPAPLPRRKWRSRMRSVTP